MWGDISNYDIIELRLELVKRLSGLVSIASE
jgi:hypothetical protein